MQLREWLFRQRVTVTDFAEKVGVSRNQINLIVNGHRNPSPKLAKQIEEATGGAVTVMELLFPEDYKGEGD